APATVSGTGPSDIAFRVRGDFGVVADLDCSGWAWHGRWACGAASPAGSMPCRSRRCRAASSTRSPAAER
ncbi:hypothetical protein, partial [Curtobacterium sp. MCPF17_001]|uniref:hypothetical protein n=1 Tax=Curtobacterium sp. MCPF17_001 TaxID=2175651 RepID=UPI001C6454B1